MKPHEIAERLVQQLGNPDRAGYMGANAALRRMNPAEPGSAAVVALNSLSDAGLELDGCSNSRLDCWLLVIHVLALARWRHHRSGSIGGGLAAMRLTDNRLKQLLSADFDVLRELLPRLARRLGTLSSVPLVDLMPLVDLIFAAGLNPDRLHQARLDIARSYTLANYKNSQQSRNAS